MKKLTIVALGGLVLSACGGDGEAQARDRARPVTYLTLEETAPGRSARVTGVAEPYRQADVGFEVGGRVEYVIDVGKEVEGPVLDEEAALVLDADGAPVGLGDVIAVLDTTRFEQAVEATKLEIASTRLGLEAYRIDLEEVAKPELRAAQAQLDSAILDISAAEDAVVAAQASFTLARTSVERDRQLVADGVLSQSELDESTSRFENAQAELAQARTQVETRQRAREGREADVAKARGAIKLKEAQIETTRAEIAELELSLEQAETDLEDCVLRAPFSGRITEQHVSRGAYVRAGRPIVTLTLIDPMKIVFNVSAENERLVQVGAQVRVFSSALPSSVSSDGSHVGIVRLKTAVADARTRTFRVDAMLRNFRRSDNARDGTPTMEQFLPVVHRYAGEGGPLFVSPLCVSQEGGYVLRLPGLGPNYAEKPATSALIRPERIDVTVGDDYFNVIRWPFREVVEAGDLRPWDMLVVNPEPGHLEGVRIDRAEWTFRPGELVPVALDLGNQPPGIYVPLQAISERNGETSVFLLEDGRVRQTPVTPHEAYRDLRRIEGEGVAPGARIAMDGVHFLVDGDQVRVIGEASL